MSQLKRRLRATVYAGSGPGDDPAFTQAGHDLGQIFCDKDIDGIFGGGSIGIMGAFSSSMISHGGNITAVIPRLLVQREQPILGHGDSKAGKGYHLVITKDMYERKQKFREADGFVVLPGGAGTRDELWEELTGIQIGDHKKPVVLVNVNRHFDSVVADIEQMRRQQFIRPGLDFDHLFAVVNDVNDVVPKLRWLLGETNVVDLTEHRAAG